MRRTKGVTAIAEAIEVRYPSDKKTSDDEIAKRAVNILEWYAVIPQEAVQVTIQRGWVTLSGQVNWQYQKKVAEDAVRKVVWHHRDIKQHHNRAEGRTVGYSKKDRRRAAAARRAGGQGDPHQRSGPK